MSDESPAPKLGPPRLLREQEAALIRKLLSGTAFSGKLSQLSEILVREMSDGGMGSIQFYQPSSISDKRRFGKQIAEGAFRDVDGVPVSVTLNLDERGELFELDVFKGDFTPVVSYPDLENFEIIERHGKLGFAPQES
jgi:hypothetical protein